MNILIFELNHAGHRMSVVGMLITALSKLKKQGAAISSISVLTSSTALSSDEFKEQLSGLPNFVHVKGIDVGPEPSRPLAAALQKSRLLHSYLGRHPVDHLYVPYADGLLQIECARKWLRWKPLPSTLNSEALLMRSLYAYPGQKLLPRLLSYWSVRFSPFTVLHLNDPYAIEMLMARNDPVLKQVALIPDPLTELQFSDKNEARLKLDIPQKGQLIGCVGAIDRRKGIDSLIKAFQNLPTGPTRRLFLAGKHSPEIRAQLDQVNSSQIISIDRYLSEQELALCISALDVVVTPYPAFVGSASIVTRAATAGKVVVGSDFGWMRSIIERFGLGICCDTRSQASLSAAMAQALERAESFVPKSSARWFADYSAPANSYAHWTDLIRRKLGLPADEQKLNWPGTSGL